MKANTKYNIRNIFGSLINNDCSIQAAKTLPWWAAIIAFLIGVFLPVVPILVSSCNAYGSSCIASTNYAFDRDITSNLITLHNQGTTFTINAEYKLVADSPKKNEWKDNEPIVSYIYDKGSAGKQYELDIYYTECSLDDTTYFNTLFKEIAAKKYEIGTTNVAASESTTTYTPSFIIIHPEEFVTAIYKHNSTEATTTSFVGNYKNTIQGQDLITLALTVEGFKIPTDLNLMEEPYKYIEGVFKNVKDFYDQSYLSTKGKMILVNTFLYLGVYAGLVLFLGLLMFLLTRSKKNYNRYLKWYQCLFISFWASVAPGLLSLVFGFILPNFAILFFVLFMGVRAMWISMKQLAPTYQQN